MHREILIACAPYLAGILVSSGLLYFLVRLSGARLQLAHLKTLNRDQQGGVQSLSFVLTLPVFVIILMFIVQLSQITIATVVVEYAAFAAARAAMVWIPAETSSEYANQMGIYRQTGSSSGGSSTNGYAVYQVDGTGPKFQKIQLAAAMACLPICPSRNTGTSANHPSMQAQSSIVKAYQAISPATSSNTKIPTRLSNKLAYALNYTRVYIEVHHPTRVDLGSDAPLARYPQLDRFSYPVEFTDNEYGWQDQLYVTVSHDFALLPGPGRLLARQDSARPGTSAESAPGYDRIAQSLTKRGSVYARTISATVRLNNEGQKSSLPYFQTLFGQQAPSTFASDYAASGAQTSTDSSNSNSQNASNDDGCCGNTPGNDNQDAAQNVNPMAENQDGQNQDGQNQDNEKEDGQNQVGPNQDGENEVGEKQDGNNQNGRDGDGPDAGDQDTGDRDGDKPNAGGDLPDDGQNNDDNAQSGGVEQPTQGEDTPQPDNSADQAQGESSDAK